jgi:hypothetical protein
MTETKIELRLGVKKDKIEELYDAITEFWVSRKWTLGRGSRPFSIELSRGSMFGLLWGGWRSMSIKLSIEGEEIVAQANLFIPFTSITEWMEKMFVGELREMEEHVRTSLV